MKAWTEVGSAVDAEVDAGLDDLLAAIRIPSVCTDEESMRRSAGYLTNVLSNDGWSAETVRVKSNWAVFAEIGGGANSVLLYGHHDVQPADPMSSWSSPPFEPVVRQGRIFGRGAGDDKGQFFGHIFAVRALRRTVGEIPLKVKLLLDGEEEGGNQNIEELVSTLRPRLDANFMFTIDGPAAIDGRPRITYGFRGLLRLKLTVRTMTRNVHSGHWGNLAPEAPLTLAQVLTEMKSPDGVVQIPGFYDRARPPDRLERAALDRIPFDEVAAAAELGARALAGPYGVKPMERMMFLPSATVISMSSGPPGAGIQAAIPAEATATIEIRYVPDMDPAEITRQIETWLRGRWPEATVEATTGWPPSRTPMGTDVAVRVARAVGRGYGLEPVLLPRSGGSSPEHVFTGQLGLHSYWAHLANSDMHNHSEDENLSLNSLHALAKASASVLYQAGTDESEDRREGAGR